MNNGQYPSARTSGLVVQEMADETLVYDLDINKAHCLNDTASRIWKLCDGNTSISEMVSRLEQNSKSPVPEELVWLAIDQLVENNLLEGQVDTAARRTVETRSFEKNRIGFSDSDTGCGIASGSPECIALSSCQSCANNLACSGGDVRPFASIDGPTGNLCS